MKTVMRHDFAQVPKVSIPRSTFNLSSGLKTTFDADYLVPIYTADIIPGSTWRMNATHFARLATPIHPILDNLYLDMFWFFVPYRLLWDDWEKFCGAQDDPGDGIDFRLPYMNYASASQSGLGTQWDYFGLPPGLIPDDILVSAMPFRAYSFIFNQWFRDENLQNSVVWIKTATSPLSHNKDLLKRGKRFDYFTSALPFLQKGTAVDLPLGTSAPIYTDGVTNDRVWVDDAQRSADQADFQVGAASVIEIGPNTQSAGAPNLYADLTNAAAATINDFRLAIQTQALLERDARSGTRYIETLAAHWGITNYPDARLQRPEFLGSSSTPINITPVANTSDTATIEQGELAGFGTASGQTSWTKSFVEHGVVIGLANARADITYSQGVERMWNKATRYDFYYPLLSGLGEQAIENKEIWVTGTGTPATDELVFGYIPRYDEYRFKQSQLTALMRPDAAGTLAAWHLSEDFATLPALGAIFIESNAGTPLDRAIAVPTEPHFIADFYFNVKAALPMPSNGIPVSLGRF